VAKRFLITLLHFPSHLPVPHFPMPPLKHESILLCGSVLLKDIPPASIKACLQVGCPLKKIRHLSGVFRNNRYCVAQKKKSFPHVYVCVCENMFTSTLLTAIHPDMCIDSASSMYKRCIHIHVKLTLTSTLTTAIHPDLCIDSASNMYTHMCVCVIEKHSM
jgi:hypothetical protein